MLFGAEIGMLVIGLYALLSGKVPQRHTPAITGSSFYCNAGTKSKYGPSWLLMSWITKN
jgi:hypothetical protein